VTIPVLRAVACGRKEKINPLLLHNVSFDIMGKCSLCGDDGRHISLNLSLCPACARTRKSREMAERLHLKSIEDFSLKVPSGTGSACDHCVNHCRMSENERGRCGLRSNQGGTIRPLLLDEAVVDWYYDPLPTNCVAEWTCPATEGHARGKNLAVFFHGCTFDCVFCQNWEHKMGVKELRPQRTVDQLVRAVDHDTYCVCFFGGDPTPQIEYAFQACERLIEKGKGVPRICWETNGSMSPDLAKRIAEYSFRTGGTVKFDLKAIDENLHFALCGTSNKQTLHNFRALSKRLVEFGRPFLVASTLLVPGYVDAKEVGSIARFVADLNPEIPYSLLAFHPDYLMTDLPFTSKAEADAALAAARGAGLRNVHVGNVHILD